MAKRIHTLAGVTFFALATTGSALAADLVLKAPPSEVGWAYELGARYFVSGGKYQKNLYDPFVTSQLNSRLTYSGETGHAGEIFGRANSAAGFFIKGYAGLGVQVGGNLQDEDFPPAIVPYSSTNSQMRDGELGYLSADVGHRLFGTSRQQVGAFVGYHYLYEKYNGFGCVQTAGNPAVCVPSIDSSVKVLSETARWHSLRLGLVGDMMLTDRLKLTAEGAVVPYTWLDAYDNHWLRPTINPLAETGHGYGFQVEALLSYQLTDAWSVGAGGRYWYLKTTSAQTQFPGVGAPSPMQFTSERWGAFIQSSYKFSSR